MGVEGGAPRVRPRLVGAQQAAKLASRLVEPFVGLVEDLGDGTPARPAGQDGLLVDGGPPVVGMAALQDPQGVEVGVELRLCAGRCEVGLP